MSKKKHSEQPNKENCTEISTIEAGDYQFLLSLEENRKATIYIRVSTIITCASLLWAMAIIIPEVFAGEVFDLPKSILQLVLLIYSAAFIICLVCSALALCEKKKTYQAANNKENISVREYCLEMQKSNIAREKRANIAYYWLLIMIGFFFLITGYLIISNISFIKNIINFF